MSKRTFIVFGLLILVLAAVIPWLAFRSKGDAETGDQQVAAHLKGGQELFQINCGTCHAFYAAGTDGNYGPDLDELLAPSGPPTGPSAKATVKATEGRVLNAVEKGVDSSTEPGRMPGGILNEQDSKEVAEFVAATAGEG
ncbi:MAG TPA: c-type cytochrome [Solirubrobacterales bacterium]|nr:c-type cytochrome [Solirubrobacterales bacterium]